MVVTTVLSRTGLAASLEVVTGEHLTGTLQCRTSHTSHHIVIGSLRSLGVMTAGIKRIERFALHLTHYVRHIVIASVGNGGTQIGNLQRSEVHLTLSDRDTDDGQSVPGALVGLVIELCIWNQTSLLARQIDAQLIAESHTHHIVFPYSHRLLHRAILLLVAYHIIKSPAEVTVAGSTDSIYQRNRRRVAMTSHMQTFVRETMITWEGCARSDDSLGKIGQRLGSLEGRTRRILSHDTTVQERFPRVLRQPLVHLPSILTHQSAWIIGRRRNHRQHRTVSWVDGNDTSNLALQQSFAQRLEVDIDTQRQVLTGNRSLVELSILVASLYSSPGIAKHNLHALGSSELLLVMLLQSQLTDIVTWLIVVILLNIAWRNLTHISQYMGSVWIDIFSHASLLHIETGEPEHLLLEDAEVLVRKLTHEELLGISRVSGILASVLDGLHSLLESLLGNAQGVAEVHRIQTSLLLLHHHHDIIGRRIIHHQLAVSVVDSATRRKLYLLQEGIGIGILLIILTHNLKRKETNGVYDYNCYSHTTNHILTLIKIVIHHIIYIAEIFCLIFYCSLSCSKVLSLAEALQCHDEQHRDGCTATDAEEPLHPIEEIEGLQSKEYQIINEYDNQRVENIRTDTDGAHGRLQVVGTVSWHEEFEKIRLKQSDEGHRSCSYSRRIGKHVDTKSHHEAPQHHRPAWMVSAEMEHHENIQQGGGAVEQVDMVEHQSLHQHKHHEDAESFYQIYTHCYLYISSYYDLLIFTFGIAVGHNTILCSTHNLKAFLHHGIIDDADITQTGKVGRKSQLYSIRQSISRIKHVQNLAHSYSRREHSRIATRYYVVAQLEVGMAWHLFQICQFRNAPLPSQIAKIASALDGTTDIRLHVEHWYHDAVMLSHEIHDAHHSGTAYHTHILMDAVSATLVDGNQVVWLVQAVGHHLGRDESVILKQRKLVAVIDGTILGYSIEAVAQLLHLLLQIGIPLGKLLVHLGQGEESLHVGIPFINLARHGIGCRKPRTALVAVILEQKHHAHHLQNHEDKPMVVFLQKL